MDFQAKSEYYEGESCIQEGGSSIKGSKEEKEKLLEKLTLDSWGW